MLGMPGTRPSGHVPAPPRRRLRPGRAIGTVLLVAWGVSAALMDDPDAPSFDEGDDYDGVVATSGSGGSYAFLATRPGTDYPITYGPCRTLPVLVNSQGEPAGGSALLLEAMAHVSDLTGLTLQYAGPSADRPGPWRDAVLAGQREAYPPALVTWSDEDESPRLEGDVVGYAGGISIRGQAISAERFITGQVVLDAPWFAEVLDDEDRRHEARAVILHELGHLVGLGHATDSRELMFPSYVGQRDFGPGDRAGLERLGGQDC
jgi:hypothetical protein